MQYTVFFIIECHCTRCERNRQLPISGSNECETLELENFIPISLRRIEQRQEAKENSFSFQFTQHSRHSPAYNAHRADETRRWQKLIENRQTHLQLMTRIRFVLSRITTYFSRVFLLRQSTPLPSFSPSFCSFYLILFAVFFFGFHFVQSQFFFSIFFVFTFLWCFYHVQNGLPPPYTPFSLAHTFTDRRMKRRSRR